MRAPAKCGAFRVTPDRIRSKLHRAASVEVPLFMSSRIWPLYFIHAETGSLVEASYDLLVLASSRYKTLASLM